MDLEERAPCVGVVHVPKSGGTAIKNVLEVIPGAYIGPLYFDRAHFGTPRLADGVPSPNADTVASAEDLAAVVGAHRAVMGHYSGPTLLEAGCTTLAVQLREPRSRLLSLYRFWQAQPAEERAPWGLWGSELVARADRPLGEFLRSDDVWPATDNAMHRQLSGTGPGRNGTTRRTLRLRRPRARLGESVREAIGVAEWADRSEAFVARVCDLLGVPEVPALSRDNVTEVRGDPQEIDRNTLELLGRLTARDSALLDELMRNGVLGPRTRDELDHEFRETAARLSFRLKA